MELAIMAINTLDYKSLTPLFKTFNGQKGYFHYPLGFFWVTGLVTSFRIRKLRKLNRKELELNNSIRYIFPKLEQKKSRLIDNYITDLHQSSGIYFPTMAVSIIAVSLYIVLPKSIISAISIVCAIVLVDAMMSRKYSISTRNIGLMNS